MAAKPVSLTLPLGLAYEPQHKELVRQHWNVTFARQGKMSVVAKRILARVLDQIRDDEYELRDFYQLHLADITESAGINLGNAYRETEAALRELAAAAWEFKSVDTAEWHLRHLLDTTQERAVGYQGGTITVLLNPQLAPYFIQIAHYTTYRLDSYLKLHSWYSMRLYEILSAFRDTGFWEVSLDEYRGLMDCGAQTDKRGRVLKDKAGEPKLKYPKVNDLITNTTAEALAELAGTEMAFRVVPQHETNRQTRGRRKILSLRFELLHPLRTTIPAEWLTHPETGPIVERLRKWLVSDRNISQYAQVLQRQRLLKLLHEWDLKEISDNRMNSREKYCNTAFVRAAKAVLDQQKAEALEARQQVQLALFGQKADKY